MKIRYVFRRWNNQDCDSLNMDVIGQSWLRIPLFPAQRMLVPLTEIEMQEEEWGLQARNDNSWNSHKMAKTCIRKLDLSVKTQQKIQI